MCIIRLWLVGKLLGQELQRNESDVKISSVLEIAVSGIFSMVTIFDPMLDLMSTWDPSLSFLRFSGWATTSGSLECFFFMWLSFSLSSFKSFFTFDIFEVWISTFGWVGES